MLNIEPKKPEISALCKKVGVKNLDVFGSATTEAFTPYSDTASKKSIRNLLKKSLNIIALSDFAILLRTAMMWLIAILYGMQLRSICLH